MRPGQLSAFILLLLILITASFGGCTDFGNDFVTNPSLRITFSRDTLSFDTIFSNITTSTLEMKVYNPHSKSVKIDRVYLANGEASGFRFNIDGIPENGAPLEGIEIWAKDSMSLFVKTTLKHTGSNTPVWVEDSICFIYNTNLQRVLLQAVAQDVKILRDTFTHSTTLSADLPYLVYDTLLVSEGVTLTLPPNTQLYFYSGACLKVEGTLVAEGTHEQPVIMRGHRTDYMLSTTPYDLVPGQWGGVIFTETSFNNRLKYTHIRNATKALDLLPSTPDEPKIIIEESVIQNSSSNLVNSINCHIEAYNSQFTNSGGSTLYIAGGDALFIHCTIANYFRWPKRNGTALVLSNYDFSPEDGQEILYPLERASFHNTIIYGSNSSEISIREREETAFEHLFDHCMLKANGTDDENFVSTVWWGNLPSDKRVDSTQFVMIGIDPLTQRLNYQYDFRLKENSSARQNANPEISEQFPADMNSINRLDFETPDIGAYEFSY